MSGLDGDEQASTTSQEELEVSAPAYTRFYEDALMYFRHYADPTATGQMEPFLTKLFSVRKGELSDEETRYLLKEVIPGLCKVLMINKQYGELVDVGDDCLEIIVIINRMAAFFKEVLTVCIQFIPNDIDEVIESIFQILNNNDVSFYINYDDSLKYDENDPNQDFSPFMIHNGDFAHLPVDEYLTLGSHYVDLVNCFCENGGMTAIIELMRKSQISIYSLWHVSHLISVVRPYLLDHYVDSLVDDFHDEVSKRILSMTEEEQKQNSRDTMHTIAKYLSSFCHSSDIHGEIHTKVFGKLRLNIGLMYFNTNSLHNRIGGLRDIRLAVKQALKKDFENANPRRNRRENPNLDQEEMELAWMNTEFLVPWLVENEIASKLISIDNHMQLVSRSPDVLAYLASNQGLKNSHLDMLWQHSIGKHESEIASVYDTIIEFVKQRVPPDMLAYIFAKICSVPLSSYDEPFLKLVSSFSYHCLNRHFHLIPDYTDYETNDIKDTDEPQIAAYHHGLRLLWFAAQQEPIKEAKNGLCGIASKKAQDLALNYLKNLTRGIKAASYRRIYLQLCVSNLRKGRSCAPSLRLLTNIIKSYPATIEEEKEQHVKDPATRADIVQELQEKFKLLDIFLDELKRHSMNGIHHQEEIDARLDFLKFYLRSSVTLTMTTEEVDQFWKYTIEESPTTDVRDSCLMWIADSCPTTSSFQAFSVDTARYIFLKKLQTLDPQTVSKAGLLCLDYYFRLINGQDGAIELVVREMQRLDLRLSRAASYSVVSTEFEGIEIMWEVAIQAKQLEVAQSAAGFLYELYMKPVDGSNPTKLKLRFVGEIMEHISKYNEKEKDLEYLRRCLTILENFLDKCEPGFIDESSSFNSENKLKASKDILKLKVIVVKGPPEAFIVAKKTHTIAFLHGKIAFLNNLEPTSIRLMHTGHSIAFKECGKTLEEYGIQSGDTIHVKRVFGNAQEKIRTMCSRKESPLRIGIEEAKKAATTEYSASEKTTVPPEDQTPSSALAQGPGYFKQLFDLLNEGGDITERVWKLITHIPVNQEQWRKVQVSGEDSSTSENLDDDGSISLRDWDEVSDITSMYKLLYSLKILDSLVTEESEEWVTCFVRRDGIEEIYERIINFSHNAADKNPLVAEAGLEAVEILLKIFLALSFYGLEWSNRLLFRIPPKTVLPDNIRKLPIWANKDFFSRHYSYVQKGKLITKLLNVVQDISVEAREQVDIPIERRKTSISSDSDSDSDVFDQKRDGDDEHVSLHARVVSLCFQIVNVVALSDILHLIAYVQEESVLKSVLLQSIFSRDRSVRRASCEGFIQLCTKFPAEKYVGKWCFLTDVLQLCVEQVSQLRDVPNTITCEFFRLLVDLFTLSYRLSKDHQHGQYIKSLSQGQIKILQDHPILEKRHSDAPDETLIGLINFVRVIFKSQKSLSETTTALSVSLARYVYGVCLFDTPDFPGIVSKEEIVSVPKCKTSRSRKAAFLLLLELCKDEIVWRDTLNSLQSQHSYSEVTNQSINSWLYAPEEDEKSPVGYVGMQNLGCICYLNSSMQQLFMTPKIRDTLLTTDLRVTDPPEMKENFVYAMQEVFALLTWSERRSSTPRRFCETYKNFDGQPIDVTEQMDANEFLNLLFDKIERTLKPTPTAQILSEVFGGSYANQIVCQECGVCSEREEDFLTVTVECKNKRNLYDALSLMTESEMLSGGNQYLCSPCHKKVDALKRVCVAKLPEKLILHLKRFEFNMDTLTKFKINDIVEFPQNLDMAKFTKRYFDELEKNKRQASQRGDDTFTVPESLPTDQYVLSGIIVHAGIADSGHYYSYIREPLQNGEFGRWLEFNDVIVDSFDPSDIRNECFGGTTVVSSYDKKNKRNIKRTIPKTNNAYMLFYKRVVCPDSSETVENDEKQISADNDGVNSDSDTDTSNSANPNEKDNDVVDAIPNGPIVPSQSSRPPKYSKEQTQQHHLYEISKKIWLNNETFLKTCHRFDPNFFDFAWDFLHQWNYRDDPNNTKLQHVLLGLSFFLDTLCRSKHHKHLIPKWENYLISLLASDHNACQKFLIENTEHTRWSFPLLRMCTEERARLAYVNLLMTCIKKVAEFERDYYLEDIADTDSSDSESRDIITSFIDKYLVSMAFRLQLYWRNFGQYFTLLKEFAKLGQAERSLLLSRHVVTDCMCFLTGKRPPYQSTRVDPKRLPQEPIAMGTKQLYPQLHDLVELVSLLVCSTNGICDPASVGPTLPPTQLPGDILELPDMDRKQLFNGYHFFSTCLRQKQNTNALADLVCHCCWGNYRFSTNCLDVIVTGVDELDHDRYAPFFRLTRRILSLKDGFEQKRAIHFMPRLLNAVEKNKDYGNATRACVRFIHELIEENEQFASAFLLYRTTWQWLAAYIVQEEKTTQFV